MGPASTDRSLQALLAAITDAIATAPDEEILAAAADSGEDPEAVASVVRGIIARSTKRVKQLKLEEARVKFAAARKAYAAASSPRIPADVAAQRALYLQVAQHHRGFTLQQRELEALPPEELVEILKQMDALGLLPDHEE